MRLNSQATQNAISRESASSTAHNFAYQLRELPSTTFAFQSPTTTPPMNTTNERICSSQMIQSFFACSIERLLSIETTVMAHPEPAPRHDPILEPEPPMIAPSAFAWGNTQPAAAASDDDGSDRNPGESWVERAYRGPSPANPSVSLRARLKRAAFFDKREREVAAGKAEPVETDAGLPDAMVEEQERELD